jgi:formate hydrogenlyase subunit 3/multisubunit Na+/H+ antiporter MnhD subunit
MNTVSLIILVPVIAGLLMLAVPGRGSMFKGILSLLVSILTAYWALGVYRMEPSMVSLFSAEINGSGEVAGGLPGNGNHYLYFAVDGLSRLIVLLGGLFGLLIAVYSLGSIGPADRCRNFHGYFLITLGLSFGTILADNLLLFIFLWGILALTLYKLIPQYDEGSSAAAKKTLIMIGSSDGLMIMGIAILYQLTGTFSMSIIQVETGPALASAAFLMLVAGSFTKAGAFPFHSWIPDYTEKAPAVSSAYLPASMDKLLGIYFLVRICHNMFVMNDLLQLLVLFAGVTTIIIAVMMALVQHDYRKLLGFHAVSQVGYMILGIGLGSALGIAAGLFHMLNNAMYKSGLFLVAGNIKKVTGEDDLDRLGGLSQKMPVTFIAALVFSLSISGVPPFNGFASKWMIYQGIIDFGSGPALASRLWIAWLALAVFGSALTLASFIKFIGGAFLGSLPGRFKDLREVGITMTLPLAVLALLCILLGVFATGYFVPKLFFPVTGEFEFYGVWQSTAVSVLILFSIVLGVIIYLVTLPGKFRRAESFIGGEKASADTGFPATGFYETIRNAPVLSFMYEKAYKGWFDIYLRSKDSILWMNSGLSRYHDGVLHTYLLWIFAGLVIILLILL